MGRIFCLMGKSSSGKDTLYARLSEKLHFSTIVPYTTRPIREGEEEGREYHFITEKEVEEFEKQGRIIELRAYNTVHGVWKYLTVDDKQTDVEHRDYLMIGTVESYRKLKEYYGEAYLVPIYIEVEDKIRLLRAIHREEEQEKPKYAELCRRFLADEQDFSEENLKKSGITKHFSNNDGLEDSVAAIKQEILRNIGEQKSRD